MTIRVHVRECDIDMTRHGDAGMGNPFVLGPDGNRDQVCDQHMEWFVRQPHLMRRLGELKGKRLGCYCGPKQRCHVDFIVDLVELVG